MKKVFFIILTAIFVSSILFPTISSKGQQGNSYGALAIDNALKLIFVANEEKECIDLIDIKAGTVLNSILSGKKIVDMEVDERRGILAAIEGETIHIVSTHTFRVLSSILVNKNLTSMAIDSELGLALVTDEQDQIMIIDLNKSQVVKSMKVSEKPVSVAVDPGLHLAVIAHHTWGKGSGNDKGRDNITFIDLISLSILKTLQGGKNPIKLTINTLSHEASAASENSDDITVIDLNTLAIKRTIAVGKHPLALSYNECLNTLSVVGGEDKGWMQVVDMNTYALNATYDFNDRLADIEVCPYLNLAAITGEAGLNTVNLPNPLPQIISISPEKALRGVESLSLSISGLGLLETSQVHLNGNRIDSTFYACGSVEANIAKEYLASTGEVEIKIINPPPEGGLSNSSYLSIENPTPTLSNLNPLEALAGSPPLTLTVQGAGFFNDTAVSVNNLPRAFTLIDQTKLQIPLKAEDLEVGGYLEVKAFNTPPGGGQSNSLKFTVLNPSPVLFSMNPSHAVAGSSELTLTLNGANFVKNSVVNFNDREVVSKYISRDQIEGTIPSEAIRTPGNYPVKVINPSPGGGETSPLTFNVKTRLEVKITSPSDGETINKAKIMVKGTIQSDTKDVGINVNGIIAEIMGNEWIANNIPLAVGSNTITATATDSIGNTDTKTIIVSSNDITQFVELSANVTSGIQPLQVYFSASTSDLIPVLYQIDFNGDGVIDYNGATFDDVSYTYQSEGVFYPKVTISDAQGNTYSDTIAITVTARTEIDTLLKGKWEGMKGALGQGNISGALDYFVNDSKEQYGEIFQVLAPQLPSLVSGMREITLVEITGNTAEYYIKRFQRGRDISYFIYFVRDEKGIWRISSF